MSLRTRLIIAFLLLSVLPLSAVTLLSYLSSVHAFELAAQREAMQERHRRQPAHGDDHVRPGRRMDRLFVGRHEHRGVRVGSGSADGSRRASRRCSATQPRSWIGSSSIPAPEVPPAAVTSDAEQRSDSDPAAASRRSRRRPKTRRLRRGGRARRTGCARTTGNGRAARLPAARRPGHRHGHPAHRRPTQPAPRAKPASPRPIPKIRTMIDKQIEKQLAANAAGSQGHGGSAQP